MSAAKLMALLVSSVGLASHRVQAQTSFITIGDWGGAALAEQQYGKNVADVAGAMASQMAKLDAKFIIGTGDNFYWCGLMNTSDFQIKVDWLDPFGSTSPSLLNVPWYNVLGNHEYGYDVQVQLDMANMYKPWVMDSRYYSRRIPLGSSGVHATFIFIDTSPCVSEYRSSDRSGWDPCGTEYPTCSQQNPSNPNDPFEGPCEFNQNILTQNCTVQSLWFKNTLAAVDVNDWLIVVGHHPSDEIDVEDFTTIMQQRGFDLYLNGHAHTMTHYSVDGNSAFVTSGNGAMVLSTDQLPTTAGKERTYNKTAGLNLREYGGHQYEQIFNMKATGFTTHTFSEDYQSLTTNFMTVDGQVQHSFKVVRGKTPSPPPAPSPNPPGPSPSPGPGPKPKGNCCHYSDATCTAGDVCCKSECNNYQTCSYTQEGCKISSAAKKHHCTWTNNVCVVGEL